MSTPTKISPLRRLVNVLSDAVTQIDEKYASVGLEFPALNKPFDETDPSWVLLSDPDVVPHSSLIVAAADQLTVSVRHPMQAVYDIAQSHTIIASLRLACETNVAEILHEAGPEGLHVKDIAAKNKLHPGKLARALRLLATYHIFAEISPEVFANNSLSSILDTGASVETLFTRPKIEKFKSIKAKHCALIELTTDETMKSCSFITDTLLDPATCYSEESSEAPCARALGAGYFDNLYAPGNEYQSARFQAAMGGLSSSDSSSTVIPGGFPWETLPKGLKIVDVGGGIGGACLEIMKKNPHLKFTVQDLPSVTDQTVAHWNRNEPKAIADGQVIVQAHSFFSPQPVKDADVFLLRYILHDWSNSKAIEILKRLREAAIPGKTRVVVIDGVIKYACAVDQSKVPGAEDIAFEGPDKSNVPTGLLPNLGRAEARNYFLDLGMLALFNGQERTLGDHIWVMEASGWKIQKIYSPDGRRISHLVAEAV